MWTGVLGRVLRNGGVIEALRRCLEGGNIPNSIHPLPYPQNPEGQRHRCAPTKKPLITGVWEINFVRIWSESWSGFVGPNLAFVLDRSLLKAGLNVGMGMGTERVAIMPFWLSGKGWGSWGKGGARQRVI